MTFYNNLKHVVRQNIREYGMFVALFVIAAFFTVATNGTFISARNISNLLNQTGYIAVLAVGMTLVIVIRHIDLSVGFLSGFIGAIVGLSLSIWNLPVGITIPLALLIGIGAGLMTGFLVAQLKIPAFVASLAGFMGYRGAILLATRDTGTIVIKNDFFNGIGNSFIPDLPGKLFVSDALPMGLHKLTLVIGLVAIVLFILNEIKTRKAKESYNFDVLPMDIFLVKVSFISLLIAYFCFVMSKHNGISWTVVIVALIVGVYHFITTKTVLGRHIYAVGGNPEAAEMSGISLKKITYVVFGSMGMLSGVCGILFTSRLQSATTTAGTLFELDAIASAYIGGVSASGGVGKVTGSIIGALVMTSLTSGMNLMAIDISLQYVVRGVVLAIAVIFDVSTRAKAK
jgi:putative multiple sugar transport system permease protein